MGAAAVAAGVSRRTSPALDGEAARIPAYDTQAVEETWNENGIWYENGCGIASECVSARASVAVYRVHCEVDEGESGTWTDGWATWIFRP
jgi:hypothetical protein